jgi:CheY-like chemotaxis protein
VDRQPDAAVLIGGRVLIVDSADASRAGLRANLEANGFAVREAANGVDAIVTLYLASERLAVVVDTYLSDMDGEDFLHLVTQDPELAARHGYVFLTESSAQPSAVTADFLAHHGIVALTKPYALEALVAALEDASLRPASAR